MKMFKFIDADPLYSIYEMQKAAISPLNTVALAMQRLTGNPLNPLSYTDYGKTASAAFQVLERVTHTYNKPEFGIHEATVKGHIYPVREKIIKRKTFCHLIHF